MPTELLKLKQEKRKDAYKNTFSFGAVFPSRLVSSLIIAAEDCGEAEETELMHARRGTCTSYHLAESYLESFSFWLFHLKRTKTL